MAAQKGLSLILSAETAVAGVYEVVGGMQTDSLTWNNEPVDITNKDSLSFRTFLEGAGTKSLDLSGSGVFSDDAGMELVRDAAEADDQLKFQLVVPATTNAKSYTALFQISSFSMSGDHNTAVTFELSLASSGVVTIA